MGLVNSTAAPTESLADWVTVTKPPQRSNRNLERRLDLAPVVLPRLTQRQARPAEQPAEDSNEWIQADSEANDDTGYQGFESSYHYQIAHGRRDSTDIQEELDHERMDDYDNIQRRDYIDTGTAVACDYTLPNKTKSKYHKQRPPKKITRTNLKITTRQLLKDIT